MGLTLKSIEPLSENSFLVCVDEPISLLTTRLLVQARTRLAEHYGGQPRIAYQSLLFESESSPDERWLRELFASLEPEAVPGRHQTIPVDYGGEYGPDLARVSELTGFTPLQIVDRHASGQYFVCAVGFAPGFAFLGGLDSAIAAERLPIPRVAVPAGSLGIGGGQTGIYPFETPGGWNLIGRTDVALFDSGAGKSLLQVGDTVSFERRSLEQ